MIRLYDILKDIFSQREYKKTMPKHLEEYGFKDE